MESEVSTPIGYAIVKGECGRRSLERISKSLCTKIRIRNNKGSGEFVVCKGKVLSGSWKEMKGEEAWRKLLEEVASGDEAFNIIFYPPPSQASLSDEFEVEIEAAETESNYFSGVGVVALGKQVLGFIHKLYSLGLDIDDVKLTVKDKTAFVTLKFENPKSNVDVSRIRRVILEYLEVVGVKDVRVETL